MWDYFVEETLSTGENVTIPFDTEEEMDKYIQEKQDERIIMHIEDLDKLLVNHKEITKWVD